MDNPRAMRKLLGDFFDVRGPCDIDAAIADEIADAFLHEPFLTDFALDIFQTHINTRVFTG
jgi:hypothetical protein